MARAAESISTPSRDDFAAMLEESYIERSPAEGAVVKGIIVAVENDFVVVDVGLKTEGRVPIKEFSAPGQNTQVKIGDEVEVYVERVENALGEAVLSRDKARREESWTRLEKAFQDSGRVSGVIFGRVKGGFTVDLDGAVAFLPGSQVDVRPVRDVGPLMNMPQPFQILKMDRRRGNIVVSRRAVLEEKRAEERSELVASLAEGQVLEGTVKNITDYGAFVELEPGVEGLVHVSEMSWVKKNVHPNKIVNPGQEVEVMVLEVDSNKRRISLGLKQCIQNPWVAFAENHPAGDVLEGEIRNITEFGLFVGLPGDIDGMVHLSDLSWDKAGDEAVKDYQKGQSVQVKVLDVDAEKERISLGVKQLGADPMAKMSALKKGDVVTVTVAEVQEGGLEVTLEGGARAYIRRADLSRDRNDQRPERFGVGDKIDALVTSADKTGRKLGLSIKAREISEEKEAVAQYGSSDSGASLGDILGAALSRAQKKKGDDEE